MAKRIFALIFLVTVGNLALCQDWENLLFIKMGEVLETQEAALSQLKGMQGKFEHVESKLQEIQEKQDHVEGKLQEIQEKQEHIEDKLQEIQEKQEHFEGQLQDISAKLETLEEIHQETKGCLRREDLEHFNNISSSGQQELESSFRQVISLLETGGIDECSEGSHNCSDHASCIDKFVQFSCICLPGFAGDGSRCDDIDECAQGKDKCSPLATCRNSVGNYSCSCNPPSEGDGRSCNCPSGFAQKGSNCEDIEECAQGKDDCSLQATCRNSVGSYSCSCNPPFEGDGRSCNCPPGFAQKGSNCEDIDECAQGKDECSPQATCRNSVGSYSCSCNPPFEGDGQSCNCPYGFVQNGSNCEEFCRSPAKVLEGVGCVKCVREVKTFEEMKDFCHQAGGSLLLDFSLGSLQEVVRAFGSHGWVGVHEGKMLESGLPLPEELWMEGSPPGSDPSRWKGLCGTIGWDSSSSSYKVGQRICSLKTWGYCKFAATPQK